MSDVSLSPSSSPLPGSRFQAADGNQSECAAPSCSPPGGSTLFDWGSSSYGSLINTIVDPSNPDNAFAGGSKENQPDGWSFASPSESTPGKSNFKVVWDVIEGDATQFFYLAFRRAETGGNSFLTFELNQEHKTWTNSAGAVIPCRTTGDLLVTYNVANSDATNIVLRAEKWTSTSTDAASGCAKTGSLSEYTGLTDGTDVQGAVNTSLSPSLVGELPGSRPAIGAIPSLLESSPSCASVSGWVCAGLFGEAGMNLKGVFGTITQRPCFAFGTAWAHSRSSESSSSAMEDYVAPASVKVRSCTISGFKWQDMNGDGIWQKTGAGAEPPVKGWQVFIDSNNNGELDSGEPTALTDSTGEYLFKDRPAGTSTVKEVPAVDQPDSSLRDLTECSYPASCASGHTVTLGDESPNSNGNNFGNHAKPTLTVTKSLSPASDPGRFNLLIDSVAKATNVGDGGTTGAEKVSPGDHTIGETAYDSSTDLANYTTKTTCQSGDEQVPVGAGGHVNVDIGKNVTCTISNVRQTGTINVTKKIDGIQTGDTFDLLVNGEVKKNDAGDGDSTGPVTVKTGANTVTETSGTTGSLSNYVSSTTCSADGKDVPVDQTTGGLTVADGQAINCTITNRRKTATLEVSKSIDPVGDKGLFNLTINGGIEAADVGNGGTTGALTVLTGKNSVGETAGTGTDLAGYSAAIACTDGKDTIPVDQKTGDLQITADGAAVVCTITNTRIYGHLSITKSLEPASDAGKFDLLINGTTKASAVGDGGTTGSVAVFPGENTVSEAGSSTDLSHYSSKWACVDGGKPVTVDTDGKVDVPAHHTVDCTVTNTRLPGSLTIVKKIAGPDDGTSRFNFLIDGLVQSPMGLADGGSVGPVPVSAGRHTVSEEAGNAGTDLANFNQSIRCADASGPVSNVDGEVKVESNQAVTCTVTNTRKSGTISIKKLVVWPALPVPSDTGKFDLLLNDSVALAGASSGDSTGKITVATGTNKVGEKGASGTDLSDYSAATTCSDSAGSVPVDSSGNVSVKEGEDVSCTITNTRVTGKISVTKLLDPSSDEGKFDLLVNGDVKATGVGNNGTTGPVTVLPGTSTVSEAGSSTDLSHYSSKWSCVDGSEPVTVGTDGKVDVPANHTVDCTVTNTRLPGSLTIVKKIAGPDDGTSRFNFLIDGSLQSPTGLGDGGSVGPVSVPAGSHTISEEAGNSSTDLANFDQAIACSDKSGTVPNVDGKLSVESNQDVTCTVTNTRKSGKLSVTKLLDPSTDGGKFDLLINGDVKATGVGNNGTTGPVTVLPGGNTVSEAGNSTDLSHYSSKWACVDGSEPVTVGTDGKVDVPANHTVDCTVTNTRLPGSLTIVKKIAGPDDGSSRFNFLIDGSVQSPTGLGDGGSVGPVSVPAGSHTVSEEAGNAGTDLANFKQDIACSDKSGTVPNVDGKLTVESNQDVTCTVTNTRKSGTISIKKLVVWPDPAPADTGKFDLLLNKSVVLAGAASGDSTGKITVATGTNTVGENGAGGTDLSNYTAVTTCLDGETPVPVDGDGNLTVKDGQDVACTITNTVRTGTLTIVKSVPGGSTQQFPFAGPLGSFNLTDGGEPKVLTLGPGSWTVSETPVTGFDFTSLNCVGEESQPNTEITGPSVTVALRAGEAVTCTWVNTPSGTPLPGKAGTAVIGGNTGCVTGAYAGFKVRGTFIVRVEWYLDGRLIKVANKPNASPYWKKWIRMANVSWGTHRIKAVVRYVTGATPRSKTLTRSFSRLHYCRGVYTG